MRIGFAAVDHPIAGRSSASCSPAASCCCGCAGRCGASCARRAATHAQDEEALAGQDLDADGAIVRQGAAQDIGCRRPFQILIADVTMSLDNVLAVAGASREHPWVLDASVSALSIALMGIAAAMDRQASSASIAGSPMSASPSFSMSRST